MQLNQEGENYSWQNNTIMSSWGFYYPEALLTRLGKDLPVKTGKTPNAKQWEMITSRENNVCVCAASGVWCEMSCSGMHLIAGLFTGTRAFTDEWGSSLLPSVIPLSGWPMITGGLSW